MSDRYETITAAGGRVVAITVDSPPQNSAMIEKLGLPFPMLSDPDRSKAIRPYGVSDEKDPREIARPAMFVVTPDRRVVFENVSTDFADRHAESAAIEALQNLDLPPTGPERVESANPQPGPKALPLDAMEPYYRGAKFAGVALRMRHPEIADDLTRYVEQMDRYLELTRELRQ